MWEKFCNVIYKCIFRNSALKIFKDATAYPAIFVIQKTNVKNKSIFIKVKQIPKEIKLFEKDDKLALAPDVDPSRFALVKKTPLEECKINILLLAGSVK